MAFRKLNTGGNATFLKYSEMKVGEVHEGRVMGIRRSMYGEGDKAKPTWAVRIKKADGTEVFLNGCTVLENAGVEDLAPGTLLKVTYKGKTKGKGAAYHDFDIEGDDGTEVPPQAAPAPAPAPAATAPSAPAAATAPDAEAIAAAKALLAGLEAPAISVPSEYDKLLTKLAEVNPKGAAAMKAALLELHPNDEVARIEKLRKTLVQQGVAL
jgi:hypothetical protein